MIDNSIIQKNRKGLYILSADTTINLELVEAFISDHEGAKHKYLDNEDMYIGKHDILNRDKHKKPDYKPDNRLVVNFAKYIVDTLNGYFIGIPVKETHKDEDVNKFMQDYIKRNDLQDNEAEISKMCSICGASYDYLYQDENSDTKETYMSRSDGFMVYDDTVEEMPLFFCTYYRDTDQKLHGEVSERMVRWQLTSPGEKKEHYFSGVPVVEFIENEERQGAFENVKTLINENNKALSEKANDVDYFADAYLKVLGALIDEDTLKELRKNRIINIPDATENIEVAFLEKPNADETQENLLNWLKDYIYQISMIANVSDETFSTASSGTALEFKLLPMKNVAIGKERKFQAALRRRWQLVFSVAAKQGKVDAGAWKDIEYTFTRNIPQNMESEAEVLSKLEGIVSKETQLKTASFISDVAGEVKQMQEEEKTRMREAVESTNMDIHNHEDSVDDK